MEKMQVTCEAFTKKMNEALHQDPSHNDMSFLPHDESGLSLFAPMLSDTERMALHKAIFDEVSKRYTIACS